MVVDKGELVSVLVFKESGIIPAYCAKYINPVIRPIIVATEVTKNKTGCFCLNGLIYVLLNLLSEPDILTPPFILLFINLGLKNLMQRVW